MPQKSKLQLPPLHISKETFGQRLLRLRKERGYTQVELAEKMGLLQTLITDYERDKLRPYHDIIIRFALAFEVTTDTLLGVDNIDVPAKEPNLKIQRLMKKIEELPQPKQNIILKTIEFFIKGCEKG